MPAGPLYIIALPHFERQINGISCRGEPNPVGLTSTLNSGRPFHPSSLSAIIIFHVYVQPSMVQPGCSVTLMIHRQSMVDILNTHLSQSPLGEVLQPLPWVAWGPPVSRWFHTSGIPTRWVTSTAGQRCVSIPRITALRRSSPITIYDFNPANVAMAKNYLKHNPDRYLFCDKGEEIFDDIYGLFSIPVYSRLPYCGVESEGEYEYHGVLMDEERLLGIKVDAWDRVTSIDVMHFG
ncbi:hypothetical protein BD779DRAFT_1094532 [Infundibulicybe gibba]|nr:hypothetical protein BD779DRAFT_1094532 [Infundibulicybe gibba]